MLEPTSSRGFLQVCSSFVSALLMDVCSMDDNECLVAAIFDSNKIRPEPEKICSLILKKNYCNLCNLMVESAILYIE